MRLVTDRVTVAVPATSANLGPGFDALGVALALHDLVEVRATTGATTVVVEGEGAGEVPTGEDHLVVRAVRAGLEYLGAPQVGLELRCANAIPHGRGLGSSAAAVVAGLVAARALVSEPEALEDRSLLALAVEFEGHPDNAAPALSGSATIAWRDRDGPRAVRLPVVPDLSATVLIPTARLATAAARASLPAHVPHADAAANAASAALLTLALTQRPELLMPGTQDRLHQGYRAAVMPDTIELVDRLREAGHAATVSGAGPSVLILHRDTADASIRELPSGWTCRELPLDLRGARIVT